MSIKMTGLEIAIAIVFFVLVSITVSSVIIYTVANNDLDIRKLTLNDRVVSKALYKASILSTEAEFKNLGKPIHTQKGAYRADFRKAMGNKRVELKNKCFTFGSAFCEDFCEYVNDNYQKVSGWQLSTIILHYAVYYDRKALESRDKYIQAQRNSDGFMSPQVFFIERSRQTSDPVGVYVLYNRTKNLTYVGQAKRLYFRVNQHLTGHGNGDVYADYKTGDEFSVKLIKLSSSGYDDLNKLEKDTIKNYGAYERGYNKTRGNRS